MSQLRVQICGEISLQMFVKQKDVFTILVSEMLRHSDGQFHQHFTLTFFVRKFVQSQTLSREKLLNLLAYKKCAHKMLMKLTPRQLLSRRRCPFVYLLLIRFFLSTLLFYLFTSLRMGTFSMKYLSLIQ